MVIRTSSTREKNYTLIIASLLGMVIALNCFHQFQMGPNVVSTTTARNTTEKIGGNHKSSRSSTSGRSNIVLEPPGPRRECKWAPDQSDDCQKMILGLTEGKPGSIAPAIGRRFLLFGDSTMGPSFLFRYVSPLLVETFSWDIQNIVCKGRYQCEIHEGRRCHFNDLYHLDYPENMEWRPPPPPPPAAGLGEVVVVGPVGTLPFCTDCAGCKTKFMQCNIINNSHPCIDNHSSLLVYGGYMTIEFAKDVEMQSSKYWTTQENILHYIRREWNTPELVQDFGKPICFVNTGHHDVILKGITRDIFLDNVQWYLGLLRMACSQVFWISSTAPLQQEPSPGSPQTVNLTRYWNEGVRQLILTSDEYQRDASVAYIDVFEVSVRMAHRDNIHMSSEFYASLASLIAPNVSSSFR